MRLSSREWALVGVALLSVGLVLFLLAGTVRSDAAANVAPGSTALVTERAAPAAVSGDAEQFRLTIDERGLRSDWRDGEDSGSLRLDVNDVGVQLDARSTTPSKPAARTGECRCSCAHCDGR